MASSAFGVEHGWTWFEKYSRAYGTAREVQGRQRPRKLRPLPDTELITLKRKPKRKKI
jgi:hypothetical protein